MMKKTTKTQKRFVFEAVTSFQINRNDLVMAQEGSESEGGSEVDEEDEKDDEDEDDEEDQPKKGKRAAPPSKAKPAPPKVTFRERAMARAGSPESGGQARFSPTKRNKAQRRPCPACGSGAAAAGVGPARE